MTVYKRNEIFKPNSYPEHTYVEQEGKDLESDLLKAVETPGEIVSLAGPSKSGKTVLIEKVVEEEYLVKVLGSSVDSKADFWNTVLDEMGVPKSVEESEQSTEEVGISTKVLARLGLSSFFGTEAEAAADVRYSESSGRHLQYDRGGVYRVIEELQEEDYLVLIDDFHYIERSVQEELAEVIKEIPHQEISIGVALVPHRSEDILRGNPDLRGRVQPLDIGYWNKKDLRKIAEKGFDKLDVDVPKAAIRRLSEEAAGSPQLMQRMCLETCYVKDVRNNVDSPASIELTSDDFLEIFERTVGYASHERTVDILDSGKESRGEGRTTYQYRDGTEGDYYNCILRAIASDPVKRKFRIPELKRRVDSLCEGKSPQSYQIKSGCGHMDDLVDERLPDELPVDWDSEKNELHIPDPYFLFYLRWSAHIGSVPEIEG